MGVHGMGDRLETEEVGLIGGRVEDVGRERRIGFNLKLEAAVGPQDGRATVLAEEGVVDPAGRKRARGGEVPLGAGGRRRFAGGQMIVRLHDDPPGPGLEQRSRRKALATPAGLEPATCRLEGGCSIQLSYGAKRNWPTGPHLALQCDQGTIRFGAKLSE